MTEVEPTPSRKKTDFMDAVVLVAESWPLLLGLPLVAGVVAYALVAMIPPQYRASSTIPMIAEASVLMKTPEFGQQFATSGLTASNYTLLACPDSTTRSTLVMTTTTNAEDAEAAVAATIATLRTLAPVQASTLARDAGLLSAQIGRLQTVTESLDASLSASTGERTSTLGVTDAIVALTDTIRAKETELEGLQRQLAIAEKAETQSPEIAVTALPKDWRVVLAAILAAATLAATIVYLRFLLAEASKAPDFDSKRMRLLRALMLNRSKNGSGRDARS